MAGDYLNIIQGDTYVFSTNVSIDGVAQNVAGATIWFMAKTPGQDLPDNQANISVSTSTGQIAISGANSNVITVTLNTAYTANLAESNVLSWALKMCSTVGNVYTLDRGQAAVCVPVIITNS
jgi:hypothetical protein